MTDVLSLTAGRPEVDFGPGDVIVHEGTASGALWILVSGRLAIRKGDVAINTVTVPGAILGEVSVLLDSGHSATVEALEPSRLRRIDDGRGWLASDPTIATLVAVGLAQRLSMLTTYLADLQQQYGDAPGLAMVADVLRTLEQRRGPIATPGSAREPSPEY